MKRFVSLFFSRYSLSALIILIEIAGLWAVLSKLWSYSVYFLAVLIVTNVFVFLSILCADSNPEYKLTWMSIVLLVPILGSVIFLLFYRRKMNKKEIARAEKIGERLSECREDGGALAILGEIDPLAAGKAVALLGDDFTASVYSDTVCSYFSLGESMWEKMLGDIRLAHRFIFLEYFIIKDGYMYRSLLSALSECVTEGVEVRILYDDIGCMGKLPKDFLKELKAKGVKARAFSRVTPSVSAMHNNRDHRKLCIIDGRIAYTGGINIGDEYLNLCSRYGHWKDGGIRVEGKAVGGFVRQFMVMWGIASGEDENFFPYLLREKSEDVSDGGFYIALGSGPHPLYKRQVGKRAITDIINQSKSYVYITTPYLIIDYDLQEALRGASLRGVDVRIITPGIADKRLVKVMTKSSYPNLMDAGVMIYEYTPGFIHEKCLVCDDEYALVGTINFDYRSLVHHFEDAVWIYKSSTVIDIRNEYMKTLSVSHKMTPKEAELNFAERILRAAVRLFAPLL